MLVPSEKIKTKRNYVLAMKSKAGVKPVSWSLNKKLATYYIVGFMNQKRKKEAYIGSNQAIQTQN